MDRKSVEADRVPVRKEMDGLQKEVSETHKARYVATAIWKAQFLADLDRV